MARATLISNTVSEDFLTRGSDIMAQNPDFKIVARDEDLSNAANVLMRRDNNSLVIYGQPGVGITSIVMGLQASKEDLKTPFDIVNKRFYFLDSDALFSSGNAQQIEAGFNKAMATLSRSPDTVLVIDDCKDFLDGITSNNMNHLINGMMRSIRNGKFQAIFEARDSDLQELFKLHSDVNEFFTFQEVREPQNKEDLRAMLETDVPSLEKFHGIKISQDAVDQIVELTTKYPGLTLNTAQPKRSKMILESAMTAYRHHAHTTAPGLDALQSTMQLIANYDASGKAIGVLLDKSKEEIEALRIETQQQIGDVSAKWEVTQKELRTLYTTQRKGEEGIRQLDDEIEAIKQANEFRKQKQQEMSDAGDDPTAIARIKKEYYDQTGKQLAEGVTAAPDSAPAFMASRKSSNSSEITEKTELRDTLAAEVAKNAEKFGAVANELNAGLELTGEHILNEFSNLSGLPLNKLNEDTTQKLIDMDKIIKQRVFGQDEAVDLVSNFVRFGMQGMKDENKPIGNFLFIGPTGTGKTELAKALAEVMFGSENAMTRFDMGGFQEKNTVSTLVGSPRGYEGYADGGLLTNAVRKKPNSIVLYDEIEKACVDVFDILLPVFDEGVLADTRGMVSTFGGVVNIMTSNIGASFFQDPDLTYDQAKVKALELLGKTKEEGGPGLRPEFRARLDGIVFFKSLELPQIELIAGKELKKLTAQLAKKNIAVEKMDKQDMADMVADHNDKKNGGRGIRGYINQNIKPDISLTMLKNGNKPGSIKITYNKNAAKPEMTFSAAPKAAANSNQAPQQQTATP